MPDVSYGQYWAAIHNDKVIKLVSMYLPSSVIGDRYNAFADNIRTALSGLGAVRSGEVVRVNDAFVFRLRPTHKYRTRHKRALRDYIFDELLLMPRRQTITK